MDDSERRGLEALIRVAWNYETTARALLDMEWISDGLSATEADFISELSNVITDVAAETVESALAWVADGVSGAEADAINYLENIAFRDEDAALQVMGMPFLQTLEGADVAVLRTLARCSADTRCPADTLGDLLSLPTLKGGITDDDAPVVAMRGWHPDEVDKTLASESLMIERRTVDLPLAGEAELAIVRTSPGSMRSMDLFENAVREAENLMGEPFPARYVGLEYIDDMSSHGNTNAIDRIEIKSYHDADDSRWGRLTLAHEVAHFYWFRGAAGWINPGWINEGMAQLMASAIENRRVGTPIDFTYSGPCEYARTVTELEALQGKQYRACMYWIGERLFVSLLRALGEDAFWEGARRLYAASRPGIDEVRQAFGADASDVIDRRYEGN